MMNKRLKAKIILKYGSQAEFAYDIKTHEAVISRVVRNRRELSSEQKKMWARKLNCQIKDIFPA